MNFNLQQFLISASTIDELVSPSFQAESSQKNNTDRAALRLAAWCRSASSGDWGLFVKRITRDKLLIDQVLSRFADVRYLSNAPPPIWFLDAQWVLDALASELLNPQLFEIESAEPIAFEMLFYALVERAEIKMIDETGPQALAMFNISARNDLRRRLLNLLSNLYSPLLYSKFVAILKKHSPDGKLPASASMLGAHQFNKFVEDLKKNELAAIFEEKPVLLRLTTTIVRQWINTTAQLITRLHSDIKEIRAFLTHSTPSVKVHKIDGDLSDAHNFGHSVQILHFEDQTKLVYKPKDLRVDVAWHNLIVKFNASSPPVDLKPVKALSRQNYGWTDFIEHKSCNSAQEIELFYRRSGAWLAVFHLFVSSDMHYQNIVAHSCHPVPIDLEMILQASTPETEQEAPETAALIEASRKILNSVLMVGMLPSYVKSADNKIFDAGGLNHAKSSGAVGVWKAVNTDGMRWMQVPADAVSTPNIPHINGCYAQLGDHLPAFIEGFEQYAKFLLKQGEAIGVKSLLDPFKKLPVRKVLRNTRFYYMLLQRLKDHRNMSDGILWSAQAEFLSRLADWDAKNDLLWPLQKAERLALVNLNIPHFVSSSDEDLVSDITGHQTQTGALPGLHRAKERFTQWTELEIQHQLEIIKVSTSFISNSGRESKDNYLFKRKLEHHIPNLSTSCLAEEAARISATITQHSTIKKDSAAWVGLDWLNGSEVGQLITLGPDLYNGTSGIALFLAAYTRYSKDPACRDLALKAIASTRLQIRQASAARWARSMGIGGANGLGSIIYALTAISELLDMPALLQDALNASNLLSHELIAADYSLDVIAGTAGSILGLMALYRKTQSKEVLDKAIACGEHLLRQPRLGNAGDRSWAVLGISESPLTGFSHGAAGFAYALSSLAKASDREEFELASQECIAYEASCYNKDVLNWPDLRGDDDSVFSSRWCHGAIGIGLARVASNRFGKVRVENIEDDINHALENTITNWPQHVDTLCCGTLGTIEFLSEAGELLNQPTLGQLSDQHLARIISNREKQGDYAWNAGSTAFNLGLFRGLSGVGYTILRKLDPQLPNILIWE